MRYAFSGAASSLLLLTILSIGCADTDKNDVSGTTFDAVGAMHPAPGSGGGGGGNPPPDGTANVDGVWRTTTTLTFNSCGSRVPSLADPRIVDFAQSDAILNAHVFSACGLPIATGTGLVTGSNVSLDFTQDLFVSPNCTLRIQVVQSGSLQFDSQPIISGTSRSTLTGIGNCGAGLPCEVRQDLLMERCPPASCTFNNCP